MKKTGSAILAMCILLGAAIPLALAAEGQSELEAPNFDNVDSIQVVIPDWDVDIVAGSTNQNIAAEYQNYNSNRYTIDQSLQGSTAIIKIRKKRGFLFGPSGNPKLLLNLSQDMNVDITVGSGDIRVNGRLSGDITLKTGSGNIQARELQGNLSFTTGSGDVVVQQVKGELSCTSGSGDIRLGDINGLMSLHTGSGDITVETALASMEAKTGSGDIRLENLQVYDAARFSTGSGDISLELLGDVDTFSFDARSGAGSIHIFNQRAERRLNAGEGSIPVVLATSSGDIRVF